MKKITLTILVLFLNFLSVENVSAQASLIEIPLDEQIENSELVIEGKVVAKESFWDSNRQNIYTKNIIEVYKVFKGANLTQVEVITRGGIVGLQAEKVTPSLQLSKNSQGLFLLRTSNIRSNEDKSELKKFSAYSGIQGFYKYDLVTNKAQNVFRTYEGIEDIFYSTIKLTTKSSFFIIKKIDVIKNVNFNKAPKVVDITSVSPSTITAGTKSVLTINGTGFGTGTGTIGFSNADDGGATLTSSIGPPGDPLPLDTQILSWTDTQIEVEVPSKAGTGIVRVTHQFDGTFEEANLTILYAEINLVADNLNPGTDIAYQTQHINENGAGGYTWQMHTDFNANANANASFIRAFDTWVCETGIDWIIGTTSGIDVAASDGVNIIRFDNGAELAAGTLGVNTSYFSGCFINGNTDLQWFVSELDIVFNDTTNWEYGPALPSVAEVDFESVAVHELGHGHQLAHVIDSNAIMHFSLSNGESNRTLSANDIAAGNDVQNRSTTTPHCGQPLMTNSACSLSISEEELNTYINVYPNPNNGEFFIQKASFINLEKAIIYDISGRLITEQDISNSLNTKTIKLANMSKGVYFLNIHSDTTVITKKIIIK